MKTFKHFFAVLICVAVLLGSTPLGGFVGFDLPSLFGFKAEAATYNGTCGENLTWTLDTDSGELNINGNGAMTDWTAANKTPWYSYRTSVTSVSIGDGVTSIGKYAFISCTNLTSATIPTSVKLIEMSAFGNSRNLTDVHYGSDQDEWAKITINGTNNALDYAEFHYVFRLVDSGTFNENFKWELYSSGELTISGNGAMPDNISTDAYPWYTYRSKITSVIIGEGITLVGAFAFNGYNKITTVSIGNDVTQIGRSAFAYCSALTSVTIPDKVTDIDDRAFYSCSGLKELTMPVSAKIYNSGNVFYGCANIEKITLTKGNGTMVNYSTVTTAPADTVNYKYTPWNISASNLKELIIEEGVTAISPYVFHGCTGITNITIPDGVTSIGEYAFCGCNSITSVTIPDGVTSVGEYAFYNCTALENTYFTGDIADWCKISFADTYATPMRYADNLYFSGELVTEVTIPEAVASIGSYVFYGCSNLTAVYYEGTPTQWNNVIIGIGNDILFDVFMGGDSEKPFKAIGKCGDSLDWILYADGELVISGTGTMYNYSPPEYAPWYNYIAKITSVTLSDGVTLIGNYAFYNCTALEKAIIPDSVTSIGNYAFYGCKNLKELTMPVSAKIMEAPNYTFYYCNNIEKITLTKGNGTSHNYGTNSEVPDEHYTYTPWYLSGCSTIVIADGVTSIGDYMFYRCSNLTYVTIADSVTSIGNYAFYNCNGMKELTIPVSTKIYNSSSTFYYCNYLEKVTFTKGNGTAQSYTITTNSSTSTYYEYTPWYKSQCPTVVIDDGVTSIGGYMFRYCEDIENVYYTGDAAGWCTINFTDYYSNPMYYASNLYFGDKLVTEFTIPETVTSIGTYVFYTCPYLTAIYYEGDYEQWKSVINIPAGNDALRTMITFRTDSDRLHYTPGTCGPDLDWILYVDGELVISGTGNMKEPTDSSYVPWYKYRDKITSVTISDSVTSIGDYAFYGCPNITSITLPDSITTIGNYSFYNCTGLNEILISSNITSIGQKAFSGCSGLTVARCEMTYDRWKEVTVEQGNTELTYALLLGTESERHFIAAGEIGENIMWYLYEDYELCFVGEGDMASYTSAENTPWYNRRDKIKTVVVSDGITSIGKNTFAECENITDVYIYGYDVSVANSVFDDCYDVNINCYSGSSAHAYAKRYNLAYTLFDGNTAGFTVMNGMITAYSGTETDIVIPAGITAIGSYVFMNNDTVVSVALPDTVTDIYTGAFAGCNNLEQIIIPESVTTIASTAFNDTDVVFACAENSFAHVYATEHGITCELTNHVTGIELTSHSEYISVNGKVQLSVTFVPDKSQNKSVIWSSSDSAVASVDENGLVTGKKAGSVVITATTVDGGYKDFCLIRVVGITASFTSGAVIDNENSYIYGLDAGLDSIEDYINLTDNSCSLEYDTLSGEIGTGSITNIVRDGEIVDSYTVIIFGDVDGNGWYDANDAFLVHMIASGLVEKDRLSEAVWRAADCNHDGLVNELDFEILNNASILLDSIDQSATQAELEMNTVYIEYMSLIDQSAGIETEETTPEANEVAGEISIEAIFAAVFEFIRKIFAFVLSVVAF